MSAVKRLVEAVWSSLDTNTVEWHDLADEAAAEYKDLRALLTQYEESAESAKAELEMLQRENARLKEELVLADQRASELRKQDLEEVFARHIKRLIDECRENLAPGGGPCLKSIEAGAKELNEVHSRIWRLEEALKTIIDHEWCMCGCSSIAEEALGNDDD